jgi:hypothetical protein
LESFTNIGQGFHIAFLGMTAMIFVSVPFIFGMPERATSRSGGSPGK